MYPNAPLAETAQIVSGFLPVDMSAGANAGDWVSLKNYHRLAVVLFKGAGTAGDDPTLTLQQATDVAGTGAKALTFTTVWTKQGTLTGVGQYTKVTQTAANTYTDLTSAEVAALWVVEIRHDDLDIDNDFDCVRATVADIGTNAQVGTLFYILYGPRFGGASLPSAIVD